MDNTKDAASYLKENIQRIVTLWEIRIRQEVDAAKHEERSILRDAVSYTHLTLPTSDLV